MNAMKCVNIISKRIKDISSYNNGIVLTEEDFSPFESFFMKHPDIEPESVERIYVKGVLEDFMYIRCLLKNIDWMLSVGGQLEVCFFHLKLTGYGTAIRPEDEIAYEIATVFKDRINLISINGCTYATETKRIYSKIRSAFAINDNINNWSFGIISNGMKNGRILDIINNIQDQNIPNYEIIICGPKPSENLPANVIVISDKDVYSDIRIPICKKKNLIADNAHFENIMIIHDRINLSADWFNAISKTKNCFDVIGPSILDEDTKSIHVIDFAIANLQTFNYFKSHSNKKKWSPFVYVDGSVIIIKKSVYNKVRLQPYLNWGEKEDVDFSRRLYFDGYYLNIVYDIIVYTLTYSKNGIRNLKKSPIRLCLGTVKYFVEWLVKRKNERKMFIKYLNK